MEASLKAWELDNAVKLVDQQRDALYDYDDAVQMTMNAERPWKKDPRYFTNVRISANALLKMVMHARSGGTLEIMGLMQGKITGNTFIVTDAFRLPVEGTETRVNAGAEADEYQVNYLQSCRDNGRPDNAIGWYHSHPGYGCWLSGIDVSTQMLQQSFQDPYLAIVIDPDRTISAGKVEIGAFRTFPEDYSPQPLDSDGYQTIPLSKIEDFGAHASKYYSLEVSHFKSTLDSRLLELLWNKYWVTTLNQSPLSTNRKYGSKQMLDLSEKMNNAEKNMQINSRSTHPRMTSGSNNTQLEKVVKDSDKVASEEIHGLSASEVKIKLFNDVGSTSCT